MGKRKRIPPDLDGRAERIAVALVSMEEHSEAAIWEAARFMDVETVGLTVIESRRVMEKVCGLLTYAVHRLTDTTNSRGHLPQIAQEISMYSVGQAFFKKAVNKDE